MARKFFYLCAGMLMLSLAHHFGALVAGAATPILPAGSEVAILQGVVADGEQLPLPTFADGSPALESECNWTLSPLRKESQEPFYCFAADAHYSTNQDPIATAGPAFFEAHRGRVVNLGLTGANLRPLASFLVVATRGAQQPTPVVRESWGQAKARYRTPSGGSVTPGAQDR